MAKPIIDYHLFILRHLRYTRTELIKMLYEAVKRAEKAENATKININK